jgi:hypothetical protein
VAQIAQLPAIEAAVFPALEGLGERQESPTQLLLVSGRCVLAEKTIHSFRNVTHHPSVSLSA